MSPKPLQWVGGVRCLGLFPKKNWIFFTPSLSSENCSLNGKNWTDSIFFNHIIGDFYKCISVILQLLFCISVSAASTDLNSLKSNWPPMVQKRDGTNTGIQLNSFGTKAWRHRQGYLTDLLWSKILTSPTEGSNWPPLVQKYDVTNGWNQMTSFGAKTWRH